jgi:hypothetical protein
MTLGNMRALSVQRLVASCYEAGAIEWDAQYRPKTEAN